MVYSVGSKACFVWVGMAPGRPVAWLALVAVAFSAGLAALAPGQTLAQAVSGPTGR